jgi:uncharacterized membrane protein YqjE
MGHQTKIAESNGSPQATSKGLARDVGEFAYDVFILAELQVQLFVADVKEYGQRVLVPGLAVLIGATLGLACFPFALAALALWLVQAFELSYAMGFLLAALVGAMASALLCVIGCVQIRKHAAVLGHSKQELIRNLNWIKKVLERNRITRGNRTDDSWRTKT